MEQKSFCMNPRSSKLYGLIKNQKDNAPISPVVSDIDRPTHQLGATENKIFKEITYNFRKSIELTMSLKTTVNE